MAHEYLITKPHGVPLDVPTMRDPSLLVYFRGESGGLVMGGYERHPAPWGLDGIPPDFNGKLLDEDWPRFEELMENALVRVPELADAEVVRLVNGPEAFTPDGEFILGPTAVRGFWVAAGFCAHGLAGRGRHGQARRRMARRGPPLARRVGDGLAPLRRAVRESRLHACAHGRGVLHVLRREVPRARAASGPAVEAVADVPAPPGARRRLRREVRWERANWFEPNVAAGDESVRPRGWAGRHWSPAIGAEHRACRETAALFDETSFAKIEVSGAGAAEFLECLCANRVAREVGQITYTSMLNARGGIECDFTVTRLAEDRFRIVTGTAFGQHDLAWIRQHAPDDGSVHVEDVTAEHACLGIWGPAARAILGATTDNDLAFGYMRSNDLVVGDVSCLALRVTYVGELGWELYCPMDRGLDLGHALEGGSRARARGGRLQGDRLDAAREGLPRWGADITPDDTPFEAGLGFAVALDKGEFIGREALATAAEPERRLACIMLADPRAVALGSEPVRIDGELVGRVTSGGYGYTVERSIAYAYVPAASATAGQPVDVEIFGEWVAGEVAPEPLFDPAGERLRD